MAYIDKITNKDTGESRPISPAADKVRVDNENYEGTDLDEVLDEIAEAIDEAGGEGGYTPPQDGIPKTDLAPAVQTSLDKADTAYQKPASGIPATDIADGVIPDVSGLATKTEVNTGLAGKANDNVVVKSISVNGTPQQMGQNGNVDISVEGTAGDDGITPHIGANGNWWVGPETDSSNDTGVHAQGPAGTSFTDADLEIANVLDGTGDVLGVGGAMMIKNNMNVLAANLNRLYNKLANMAFWDSQDQEDAEPTELDWSIPKHLLTVTNNNANAKVYRNGAEVTGSLNIEENATVELVVAPVGDYVVSGVSPSTGTATDLGDGTFKVVLTMGNSDIALTLTVTTSATYAITVNGSHVTASGDTRIVAGGTATVNLAADNGFELPSAASGITISGATITSYTPSQDLSTAVLVIGSATGAVTIGVTVGAGWLTVPHDDVSENGVVVTYGMQQGRSIWSESDYRGGQTTDGVANGAPTVALMPAGVPADVKLATATLDPNTTSPGNSQAFFFATGGKRYLNVILTGVDTTYDYALAVACYYDSVIGAASFDKSMFVRRIAYATYNTETVNVWKLDLFTAATGVSASEGDIKYIKLLFVKRTAGTNTGLDSRTWLDNAVIKFKMTDD